MIDDLKRQLDKNKQVDSVRDAIDETIDSLINDDAYLSLYPILSPSSIDIGNEFFGRNDITPNVIAEMTSEELKTASYLAEFYKEKVTHNVGDIDRYLWFLGYEHSGVAAEILCQDVETEYFDEPTSITFQEYLALQDGEYYISFVRVGINVEQPSIIDVKINTNIDGYVDGFDVGFDIARFR